MLFADQPGEAGAYCGRSPSTRGSGGHDTGEGTPRRQCHPRRARGEHGRMLASNVCPSSRRSRETLETRVSASLLQPAVTMAFPRP